MKKVKTGVIILAGGQGKRMEIDLPKVLVPINGQTMISRQLRAVDRAKFGMKPVIVVGYKKELVKKEVGSRALYAWQRQQLGTGHAVRSAEKILKNKADQVIVTYGDHPFVTAKMLRDISRAQQKTTKAMISMITVSVPNFYGPSKVVYKWGRIIRDKSGKFLEKIIEFKDATPKEKLIREVNSGHYCFDAKWLWRALPRLKKKNAQNEYYLTDLIALAVEDGFLVVPVELSDWRLGLGTNTIEETKIVEALAKEL